MANRNEFMILAFGLKRRKQQSLQRHVCYGFGMNNPMTIRYKRKGYKKARWRKAEQRLKDQWGIEIDDANDDYDYDPCYECRGLGDDYIINDDGELESWCDKCGVNPDRMKDKE